ncbi:MAG: PilX N-terminal domain-containing pilus assembly protein [Halieaceae bacterium]
MKNKIFRQQQGVVLIVSLFFLLLLSILAAAMSQTNILQLQMAGNDAAKVDSMQRALAIVDAMIDNTDNTPVVGDIGYRVCPTTPGPNTTGCNQTTISLPADVAAEVLDAGIEIDYYVDRVGPLETPAPFFDEGGSFSADSFKVARQEVTVRFDRTDANLGLSEVTQGYLRLIVSPPTIVTITE